MKTTNILRNCTIALTATFLFGCGIMHGKTGNKQVRLSGTLLIEEPVCQPDPGGGIPESGKLPLGNATYYIKHGSANVADSIAFAQLKTDENGKFSIKLAPGNYALIHPDKMLSYGDFKLKHTPTTNYFRARDEDCFRRWYYSADFLLSVQSDTTVTLMVKSRCFTKTNPCAEYIGPR